MRQAHVPRGTIAFANPASTIELHEQPVTWRFALATHGGECVEQNPCVVQRLPRVELGAGDSINGLTRLQQQLVIQVHLRDRLPPLGEYG